MLLLDEVLDGGAQFARCRLTITPASPFADNDGVPIWVGIEYMAQTIAVYAGLQAELAGEPVKVGFLLGTRRFQSDFAYFQFGDVVDIEVTESFAQGDGLSVFSCVVTSSRGVQRAQITVYQPDDATSILKGEQL